MSFDSGVAVRGTGKLIETVKCAVHGFSFIVEEEGLKIREREIQVEAKKQINKCQKKNYFQLKTA